MRKPTRTILAASAVAAVLGAMTLIMPATAAAASADNGKKVAFDRKKGNCLACHQIAGGDLAGNIGPPLVAMKARFPDKAKLRAQIWDATALNPNTMMPPFGKHKILSESEIDDVVEFLYTL